MECSLWLFLGFFIGWLWRTELFEPLPMSESLRDLLRLRRKLDHACSTIKPAQLIVRQLAMHLANAEMRGEEGVKIVMAIEPESANAIYSLERELAVMIAARPTPTDKE